MISLDRVKNGQVVPPFGPFLSDPKAYFDSTNGHFIVTELEIGIDPITGNFGSTSTLLIAVSMTNDPLGLTSRSNQGPAGLYKSLTSFVVGPRGAFRRGKNEKDVCSRDRHY